MPHVYDAMDDELAEQVQTVRSNAITATTAKPGGGAGFWDAQKGFTGTPGDLRVLQAGALNGVRSPAPRITPDPANVALANQNLAASTAARMPSDMGSIVPGQGVSTLDQQSIDREKSFDEIASRIGGGATPGRQRMQDVVNGRRQAKGLAPISSRTQATPGILSDEATNVMDQVNTIQARTIESTREAQAAAAEQAQEFAYRQERDAVKDHQWQAEHDHRTGKAGSGSSSSAAKPPSVSEIEKVLPLPKKPPNYEEGKTPRPRYGFQGEQRRDEQQRWMQEGAARLDVWGDAHSAATAKPQAIRAPKEFPASEHGRRQMGQYIFEIVGDMRAQGVSDEDIALQLQEAGYTEAEMRSKEAYDAAMGAGT